MQQEDNNDNLEGSEEGNRSNSIRIYQEQRKSWCLVDGVG